MNAEEEHDPWDDFRFHALEAWLNGNLVPSDIRLACVGEGLLKNHHVRQLIAEEAKGPAKHNEYLFVQILKAGGADSFERFLRAMEKLGPIWEEKTTALKELRTPANGAG